MSILYSKAHGHIYIHAYVHTRPGTGPGPGLGPGPGQPWAAAGGLGSCKVYVHGKYICITVYVYICLLLFLAIWCYLVLFGTI